GFVFAVLLISRPVLAGNCRTVDLPKGDETAGAVLAQNAIAAMAAYSQPPFVYGGTTVSVQYGSTLVCQTDSKNGNLDASGHIIQQKAQLVHAGQQPAYFPASQLGQGMGCDPMFEGVNTHVVICTGSDMPIPYTGQ